MLVAIPLLSLIIPIVFMGCRLTRYPLFGWDKFLSTMVITTILWLGNRMIMVHSRTKYPLFDEVRKRLWYQSVIMFLFTLVFNNLLGFLSDDIFFADAPGHSQHSLTDVLINSNAAAFFCTIMIIAIYESIYFMNALRQSVEETEQLKRESLSAQLNALRTQVNPHFLFNNLNTLCSIIPDDPKLAVDFVQQLSKVYRHILQVKDEKAIPLREELAVLKAYSFLLQTRFGSNLQVHIDVSADKLEKKIVPLSLQLLMENAIKHNIVSAEKPLRIDVYTENGSLVVSNNLQKKHQLPESTGIGIQNIRNRYRLLGDKTVAVTEGTGNFTVSIPLLAN